MFFEKARWQYAIEKGLFKDMNKAVMYQLTTVLILVVVEDGLVLPIR